MPGILGQVANPADQQMSQQQPAIFEPGAKLKVEAEGEGGGEGPAWHARRVSRTDLDTGKVTILTEKYDRKRYNNPNDLTIDSKGRIYFSDPRYGSRVGMEILDADGKTIEGVYRIDPDKKQGHAHHRPRDRSAQRRAGLRGRQISFRR